MSSPSVPIPIRSGGGGGDDDATDAFPASGSRRYSWAEVAAAGVDASPESPESPAAEEVLYVCGAGAGAPVAAVTVRSAPRDASDVVRVQRGVGSLRVRNTWGAWLHVADGWVLNTHGFVPLADADVDVDVDAATTAPAAPAAVPPAAAAVEAEAAAEVDAASFTCAPAALPMSSSLPERGRSSSRFCLSPDHPSQVTRTQHPASETSAAAAAGDSQLQPGGGFARSESRRPGSWSGGSVQLSDSFCSTASSIPALDLNGGEGPTLRPSIPVQRYSRATSHRRKDMGRYDEAEDCMWLLGDMVNPPSNMTLTKIMLEETQPIEVGTLLWAWCCAIVGILAQSFGTAKAKNMSLHHNELQNPHSVLVSFWVSTTQLGFLVLMGLVGTTWSLVKGTASWERWSLFRTVRGSLLLGALCVLQGTCLAMWLIAMRYSEREAALVLLSAHPFFVLMFRAIVGGGQTSTWGERIGAFVIVLGAACFGLGDLFIPPPDTDSSQWHAAESNPVLSIIFTLVASLAFSLALILAKHIQLQKEGREIPLAWLLCLVTTCSLIGMMVVLFLVDGSQRFHFNDSKDRGVFGWAAHSTLVEVLMLGVLQGFGVLGMYASLKVLPAVIVSAIFAMQPALSFLSDLATSSNVRPVPLPTQSVGVLCIIAGCICVCRSGISRVAVIDEHSLATSNTSQYGSSRNTLPPSRGGSTGDVSRTSLPRTRSLPRASPRQGRVRSRAGAGPGAGNGGRPYIPTIVCLFVAFLPPRTSPHFTSRREPKATRGLGAACISTCRQRKSLRRDGAEKRKRWFGGEVRG